MPRNRQNKNAMVPKRFRSRIPRSIGYGAGPAASGRMIQPSYKPVVHFTRKVTAIHDIATNGIAQTVGTFLFTFSDLPDFSDFTNLFQAYRLVKIKLEWRPEYTELTDAALVSNAVNVNFNTAIDPADSTPPPNVDAVTQYQSCKSTGITRIHKRTFKPSILMGGITPCNCAVSTQSPNERHYALKYGIPPTGVAMTFRSVATYFFECSGAR